MLAPMTALTLRLTHPCGRCSRPLSLRTLSAHAHCVSCGHSTALSPATWEQLVPRAEVAPLLLQDSPSADGPLSRRMPRCRCCARPVALSELPRAVPGGGLRCTCGEWITVRAADARARALVPGALYIIGEKPATLASAPVLLACMGCGSAMSADGRQRVVSCGRCKSPNYLPDALWSTLHPVEEDAAVTVVGRLLEEERLALSLESPATCCALAARSDLAPALWPTLAAHADASVRATLAANPDAPVVLRAALAGDPDPAVRAALSGCAAVHPRLLLDADASVRAALAAHPDTPPETLARLAEDPAPTVRQAVAQAAATPAAAQCAMIALESEESVLLTLLARDDLPVHALSTLAADPIPEIRQDARAHPDFVIARRRRRRLTLMLSSALVLFGGAGGLLAATLIAVRFSDELLRMVP